MLDNSSITTHLCSSSADSFVKPDSSRVDNFVEDEVDDICISFVPESSLLPVTIKGRDFHCLIDSGAAFIQDEPFKELN
ncbi:TPA_asm: hypothetical protein [Stylophora coral adintovirus]|nr:TPA_asm: hypothetical protein [Stylophora coral adintovirus]